MATSKTRNYDEDALNAIAEAKRLIDLSREKSLDGIDLANMFTARAQVFATIAVAYSNLGDQS